MTDKKTLLHISINTIPRHLLGSLRLPHFGTGIYWLLCHPSWSTFPSKKSETWQWMVQHEVLFIALSASGGMPFIPGNFFFELFDGLFDLAEGDGSINGSQAQFLFNEIKYRVINRSVVV
jgi:hypothetical protein